MAYIICFLILNKDAISLRLNDSANILLQYTSIAFISTCEHESSLYLRDVTIADLEHHASEHNYYYYHENLLYDL